MEITTKYKIGDKLTVNGMRLLIRGIHIYISNNTQTERYYFGKGEWLTIKIKQK